MPIIKKYKIRKSGRGYEISLPIDWIRFYNLKEGDEVVAVADSVIVIATDEEKAKKAIQLIEKSKEV